MYPSSAPPDHEAAAAATATAAQTHYNNNQVPATGVPSVVDNNYSYSHHHNYNYPPQVPPHHHHHHQPYILAQQQQAHTSNTKVEWSTGLFDCFSDINNCCITFWCPCITFGQIAEIVDKGSTSCGASGAMYTVIACLIGTGCIYSSFYRSKMRRQYMLEESPCWDWLVHCCCEPCALCQEYRELHNRGFDMLIGWQGNVEKLNQGVPMTTPTPPPPPLVTMNR